MTRGRGPRPDRSTLGRLGEQAAARFLRERGFKLVRRNLRTVHGEIDLLVRRRRLYVAVEVKTRTWHPAPERAVGPDQLARLERALRALAPVLRPRPRTLRIDVVAVTPGGGDPGDPARCMGMRHFVLRGPFAAGFAPGS